MSMFGTTGDSRYAQPKNPLAEAIKVLIVAGKKADVAEVFDRHGKGMAAEYDRIRENAALSDAGRRHEIAKRYLSVHLGVSRDLERMAAGEVRRDRSDAEQVFGIKGLPGDPASLIISQRDAADRVAAVNDKIPETLAAMLDRATRAGDEVMARAIVERGIRDGLADVVNQFTAARPSQEAAAERLWHGERAETGGFTVALLLSDIKPSEFTGLGMDSIQRIADTEPGQEPAKSPNYA